MKAKIEIAATGAVTLVYDDPLSSERTIRVFSCAKAGGYVRNALDGSQVCDRLSRTGETLRSTGDGAALADVIRNEYHRMIRAARKEVAATHD